MRIKPLNVRKKKRTTKCDKSTIKYDVGTAQCKKYTVKCEEKNKGITKYDKKTVIYDVGIT